MFKVITVLLFEGWPTFSGVSVPSNVPEVLLSTKTSHPSCQFAVVEQIGLESVIFADLQTDTRVPRFIASERAKLSDAASSFARLLARVWFNISLKLGAPIAARMPTIATVTMSSTKVKPKLLIGLPHIRVTLIVVLGRIALYGATPMMLARNWSAKS